MPNDLTDTPLPALERLAREKMGWRIESTEGWWDLRRPRVTYYIRLPSHGRDFQRFPDAYTVFDTEAEAHEKLPALTADEYLSLLDGLPRESFGSILDDLWHWVHWTEEPIVPSDALKRAILIAYLDNPTGTNESQSTKEA